MLQTSITEQNRPNSSFKDDLFGLLLEKISRTFSYSQDLLTTLTNVMIYEPMWIHNSTFPKRYLLSTPTHLPKYLETFGDNNTIIVDGPPTFICTGKGDNPHMFLQGVGSVSCNHCEETKCKLCVKEVTISSKTS